MQKFLGQRLNSSDDCNQIHSSNNARSLTAKPPGNSSKFLTVKCFVAKYKCKTCRIQMNFYEILIPLLGSSLLLPMISGCSVNSSADKSHLSGKV